MNIIFNKFEKVNEDMHIASKIKLRDSIHNIVMENLQPGEEMKILDLSQKLKEKFNIKISEDVLERLIFVMWWRKDDYTIFREQDKKWLDVWPFKHTIERKKRIKDPPLGKYRRKIKKEEEEKERQANWKTPYYKPSSPTTRYSGGKPLNGDNDDSWKRKFWPY